MSPLSKGLELVNSKIVVKTLSGMIVFKLVNVETISYKNMCNLNIIIKVMMGHLLFIGETS